LAFIPFRVPSLHFPHNPFQNCACLPKVRSLLAASLVASTQHGGFHAPTTFRPQAFSTSRRLTPQTRFAGLFHPTNHVQGYLPFKGFPLRAASLPHRQSCFPLAVANPHAHRSKPVATNRSARLRGLTPHEVALLQSGVNQTTARSPLRVCVSSRPSHPCR